MLTAAADAFVTFGYHGTTMREIAKRAELSVPGLYHHYPSKQNMLVAVLDTVMTELRSRMAAAEAEAGDDPVLRLELLVTALVLFQCHRTGLSLVAMSEMRSLEPASRRRIATGRTALQRQVDGAVLDGAARGLFRVRYPLDASRAVVTMSVAVVSWFRAELPLSPEQVADRYVDYALGLLGISDPD
ncbi:MAG TPA: TetR/AcrR family transcriptional regulator [Pseudonocardia sp.]